MSEEDPYEHDLTNLARELENFQNKYPMDYRLIITKLYFELRKETKVCALLKPKK